MARLKAGINSPIKYSNFNHSVESHRIHANSQSVSSNWQKANLRQSVKRNHHKIQSHLSSWSQVLNLNYLDKSNNAIQYAVIKQIDPKQTTWSATSELIRNKRIDTHRNELIRVRVNTNIVRNTNIVARNFE